MKSSPLAPIAVWALLSPISCFAGDMLSLKIMKAERALDMRDSSATLLNLRLEEQSSQQFALWTSRHLGEKINLIIDGRIVMQPRLLSPINSGSMEIRGVSAEEIKALIPKLLDGRSALSVEGQD